MKTNTVRRCSKLRKPGQRAAIWRSSGQTGDEAKSRDGGIVGSCVRFFSLFLFFISFSESPTADGALRSICARCRRTRETPRETDTDRYAGTRSGTDRRRENVSRVVIVIDRWHATSPCDFSRPRKSRTIESDRQNSRRSDARDACYGWSAGRVVSFVRGFPSTAYLFSRGTLCRLRQTRQAYVIITGRSVTLLLSFGRKDPVEWLVLKFFFFYYQL